MAEMIKEGNRYINLDNVMWIEEDPVNLRIFFEKSTILTFPKAQHPNLLTTLESMGKGIARSKIKLDSPPAKK